MSKRKTSTLGELAAGAAAGRRVVASVGQLDGAFLAALQRLQLGGLVPADGAVASTWADGIDTSNPISQMPEGGRSDGTSDHTRG